MASMRPGPFREFYLELLAKGMKPAMARLTLARKIAAITLTLWKKGESFDAEKSKTASSLSVSAEEPLLSADLAEDDQPVLRDARVRG